MLNLCYIYGKYMGIETNKIIIEQNKIGYCGYYLSKNDLIINQNYQFYVCIYQNQFSTENLFFDNKKDWTIASKLIHIKNIGPQTIKLLLNNYTSDELIEIIKFRNWEELIKLKSISQKMSQSIINAFANENSVKNNIVIDSFKNLGYNSKQICKIWNKLDLNKKSTEIVKDGILLLGEFLC